MNIISQDRKIICNYNAGCSISIGEIYEGPYHTYLPIAIEFIFGDRQIELGKYETLGEVRRVMNDIIASLTDSKDVYIMPEEGEE